MVPSVLLTRLTRFQIAISRLGHITKPNHSSFEPAESFGCFHQFRALQIAMARHRCGVRLGGGGGGYSKRVLAMNKIVQHAMKSI